MKILAFGVILLAGGVAMLIFSDLDPTTAFIGGAACVFLGIIDLLRPAGDPGPSASDPRDVIDLTRHDR